MLLFWAKNDEEAKEIAMDDFANKASFVLQYNKDILETWIDHTPHTLFYDLYDRTFGSNGDMAKWITKNKASRVAIISETKELIYERVASLGFSEKDIVRMMGGGEYPFICLEKVEENKYQYHISR